MPMDFPSSPVVNQTYNGYVWSGTAWESANPNTISLTGQVIVADAAARNALYPSPVQGNAVFRSDLGYEEVYYAAHNATTNPGGRTPAGWYPNQRNMGLVPIVPATVNFSGGAATANTLGQIDFSAVTSISLNNVFSSSYLRYKIIFNISLGTVTALINMRLRNAGTDNTAGSYFSGLVAASANTGGITGFANASAQNWIINSYSSTYGGQVLSEIVLNNVAIAARKTGTVIGMSNQNNNYTGLAGGVGGEQATAFDGFTIFPAGGNMTGSIQVFGYNS